MLHISVYSARRLRNVSGVMESRASAEKDSHVKEAATVPYTMPRFTCSKEGRPSGRVDR